MATENRQRARAKCPKYIIEKEEELRALYQYDFTFNILYQMTSLVIKSGSGCGHILGHTSLPKQVEGEESPTRQSLRMTRGTDFFVQNELVLPREVERNTIIDQAKALRTDAAIVGFFCGQLAYSEIQIHNHLVVMSLDRCNERANEAPVIAVVIDSSAVSQGERNCYQVYRLSASALELVDDYHSKEANLSGVSAKNMIRDKLLGSADYSLVKAEMSISDDIQTSLFLDTWSAMDPTIEEIKTDFFKVIHRARIATGKPNKD